MDIKNDDFSSQSLIKISSDFILLILELRSVNDFGDSEILRKKIINLLNRIERQASNEGYAIDSIQLVQLALVAFIDEIILDSDWEYKMAWKSNSIQMHLYNRSDLGDVFFKKMEELNVNTYDYLEILEIYYTCLGLGFRGRYGNTGRDKLSLLIDQTYNTLKQKGHTNYELSPEGSRQEEVTEIIKNEFPIWYFGIGAVSLVIIYYLILSFFSSNTAQEVVQIIENII